MSPAAFSEGLKHHHAFSASQNHPAQAHHFAVADGVADDGKSLLPDLIGRGDIIGTVDVSIVDFRARHEAIDFDGMGALDLNFFQFRVLDLHVLALGDFVAAADIVFVDWLTGFRINILLLESVPRLFVDAVERHPFRAR